MVVGTKVKGGPLDEYEEYVIALDGTRHGVPGTRRNVLQPIQDQLDVRMADAAEKRARGDSTDSEKAVQPSTKKSETTPSQPNLPGKEDISPPNQETHLINPLSRERNRNGRRAIFTDEEMKQTEPTDTSQSKTGMQTASVLGARSSTTAELGTSGGKKSRTIMPLYTSPRWKFLQEREMVRLPLKIYFSINKLDRDSPVVLKFQLNEYWNQFRNTSFTSQNFIATNDVETSQLVSTFGNITTNLANGSTLTQSDGLPRNIQNRVKGLSQDMAYDQAFMDNGTLVTKPLNINYFEARKFPRTTPSASAPDAENTGYGLFGTATGDIQPDYRNFYERFYQVRHVHGCAWKLTITNPAQSDENRGVVFHKQETLTTGLASANQNLETDKKLQDCVNWPHLQSVPIAGRETVITGYYRSDNAPHDVIDADEIKEWYPTSTINLSTNVPTIVTNTPTYEENQTFLFYADGDAMQTPSFNAYLEIDWVVEYKDLRRDWRNPVRSATRTFTLGTVQDLYPAFVEPAAWPSKKNFTNVDLQKVRSWFPMGKPTPH